MQKFRSARPDVDILDCGLVAMQGVQSKLNCFMKSIRRHGCLRESAYLQCAAWTIIASDEREVAMSNVPRSALCE